MKKMNSHYISLKSMALTINDIISDLKYRRDSIDDKAYDEDRDMTSMEQEMHDKLNEQISDLEDCVGYIKDATECLKSYIDEG